jgi:putative ABC transport system ATP-binding protein
MRSLTERNEDQEIRLEGLTKSYQQAGKSRVVLNNLSVTFQEGEFVAIRGRSGSGKTTLLNLLAGIDDPTSGKIYYGGLPFSDLPREQRTLYRRDHIGFVFQFFNLIPTLSLLENVLLPAELSKVDLKQAQARALELLGQVGLQGRESDTPDRLSGGEQQRVALARAVMLKPMVILADEPTGNLDQKTGDDVLKLLSTLREDSDTTLIMVTHSHTLANRADRVLYLENGVLNAYES